MRSGNFPRVPIRPCNVLFPGFGFVTVGGLFFFVWGGWLGFGTVGGLFLFLGREHVAGAGQAEAHKQTKMCRQTLCWQMQGARRQAGHAGQTGFVFSYMVSFVHLAQDI